MQINQSSMRVLLICGDHWHSKQMILNGVAPLAAHRFQFDVITEAKDFDHKALFNYPAVLLTKSGQTSQHDKSSWITREEQKTFVSFVEKGGGLLVVHSGADTGENAEEMDSLTGCRFIYHPNECPVTVQPIKRHPITEGVQSFCEIDEHYRIDIIAPDADILIASYSPPQGEPAKYEEDPYNNTPAWICPAGYVRTQGKGKVCVLTPGHNLPVWLNSDFQKILVNALHWVKY